MNKQAFDELAAKIENGTATKEELNLYNAWFNTYSNELEWDAGELGPLEDRKSHLFENIHAEIKRQSPAKVIPLYYKLVAAASIALLIIGGAWFYRHQEPVTSQLVQNQPEAISPKQQGIFLTLGNGKHLVIDQRHHGQLKTDDGAEAEQSGEALTYSAQSAVTAVATQTLTNNSGNKFSLTLADGSQVYLDAQSTITYPTMFNGKERKVSITGQAYFKVKHNAGQPFYVTAANETVEDIGTEFNINAYEDETAIKTTLVEGAVKINHTLDLKPGEQAQFINNELKTVPADIEAVTAWLQGKMVFHHEPLESILNKVSRIYDIQIVWLDIDLKKHKFGGSVNRTKQLATILNFFRNTGEVDFLVEGKTVKVFKPKKK